MKEKGSRGSRSLGEGIKDEGHIEGSRKDRMELPVPPVGQVEASCHHPPVRQATHFTMNV